MPMLLREVTPLTNSPDCRVYQRWLRVEALRFCCPLQQMYTRPRTGRGWTGLTSNIKALAAGCGVVPAIPIVDSLRAHFEFSQPPSRS